MSDETREFRPNGQAHGPTQGEVRTAGGASSRTSGRGRFDTGSEWFWPVANLLGLAAVIVMNALATIVEFNGRSTGDVVNADPVYFQPAGWAFSIWSLIYILLGVFVVYSFLPAGRRNARIRGIGPGFLVANVANISWLLLWHWEQWFASLLVITLLLLALAYIYARLRRGRRSVEDQPTPAERLMVWTPFSVYLGWITVALLANVTVWSERTGTEISGLSPQAWAVVAILIAVGAAALMAIWQRDPSYTAVIAWGVLAVAVEQWDRSKSVSVTAIIGALAAAALVVFGALLAYETRAKGYELPQHFAGLRRDRDGIQGSSRDRGSSV
ncbi:MAG TPA: hypothetical protein VD789_07530 [Thermomicrobiales bacterium]|nr:hypothetical protein [Thermomicrobiales bacterium]